MCGICGLLGYDRSGETLQQMLVQLRHRGPDNTGTWATDGVALGHTRLAIVDLSSAGNQPLTNEDNTLWLVANGEIYNSEELRRELEAAGHRFRSHSDNEVLLHLYENHGEQFLPRINGMIAFALWDGPRKRLLLARDRLGIKPLYVHTSPGRLAFASEIKALLVCREIATGIDPEGLAQYLTYENTFGQATLHHGVNMVEPGQFLIWESGKLRKHDYWKPVFQENGNIGFLDACRRYREVAERAVKRHLMSDVAVSAYLSSGFDSSTVCTLASHQMRRPLATYTGAFSTGGWYDETGGAQAVATRIGSEHHVVEIAAGDLVRHMDDILFALDEPRMGMGSFSQYIVAKEVSRKYKVILTGHGGDELFAGYPVFKLPHLLQQKREGRLFRSLLDVRKNEWPHLVYFMLGRIRGGRASCSLPVIFPEKMLREGLQSDVYDRLHGIRPDGPMNAFPAEGADSYQRLMTLYLRTYLPGLFVVEDKISMAHSLESRTPLCDNELVDTALSIPLAVKLHADVLKAIPKKAMQGVLPEILYQQPKRGFPTPLSHWLRGELKEWMKERLLDLSSPLCALFRPQFLERLVNNYLGSCRKHVRPLDEIQTHRIWALLSLEAWLRQTRDRLGVQLTLS